MRTRILSAWLVGALPLAVSAQSATSAATQTPQGAAQVGGIATIDYVTLRAGNLGSPLRFGHLIAGSELVQFNGQTLVNGPDYGMDYETGVVYLKRAQRTGDEMVVSYRYDPQGKTTAGANFVGVNSFTGLSLAPGMGLVGGFGLAERAADGTVLSSNVFGWNNRLNFGGGSSLGGLYLYSDRRKADTVGGLSMDANAKPGDASTEEGASKFLLQNFRTALMGGNLSVDYQEISKNFASAGQVKSAGYADTDVARLMKERGLRREGASLSAMKFGSGTVGASYRTVDDAQGHGLNWSSYSLQQGALKLNMSGQRVGRDFSRFGDLSEADHDQLAKETGLSRQNLSTEFAQKTSKFSFTSNEVTDDHADQHAIRREAKLDTGRIGLNFGQQDVGKSFARVGSLTAAEQGQWSRAVGIQRQWEGLTTALGGKNTPQTLAFNELNLKGPTGRFSAQDASFASKTWTVDHVGIGGKGSALPTGALLDAEGTAYTKRIAGFFGTANTNDGQRAAFLASGDVDRNLTKITGNLGKGATLAADQLKFGQGDKGGSASSVTLATPKVKASFRQQGFGDKFTDATRLMDFEQAKMGTIAGLQRTDISFGVQMDKIRSFNFGQTQAKDTGGNLDRTTLAYAGKGVSVNVAQRDVSKGFTSAGGMVDPEAGLLAQFVGFQERDATLNYSATPGVKLTAFLQDAANDTTKEGKAVANIDAQWQVDKVTSFGYTSQQSDDKQPLTTLFSQSLQRMSAMHSFGSLLTVKFQDEQVQNGGTTNTAPDYHKQYLAVESKVDKNVTLKSEQTRTDYGDGNKEDISANSVSTAISKNLSVSVTDTTVDRKGDDNDEKKTNYGFSYDLGKGLKLSYGFAQSLVGTTAGTTGGGTETLTFGQTPNTLAPNQMGSVGASNIGGILVGGGYGQTTTLATDPTGTHTQSFSNFALSTAKPITYAGITELKFNLSLDQAADYSQYIRENQTAGVSGKYGKNVFALAYKGQLANPNLAPTAATVGAPNIQAVDRSVALTTDPSPKAPFVVAGAVKYRTLPDEKDYMSRNFTVTARPLPGIEVTNQVQTNLEQANPNALLGSTLLADRGNKWTVGFKGNGDTSFGASWEEKVNDTTQNSSTLSAVNLTLFQKSGSPLKLTYGMDEVDGLLSRRQITRCSLEFDAKATSTQTFSLYVGNVDYAYIADDPNLKGNALTIRMNYQIRF